MSSKDHKAQKAVLIASLVILMIALGTSVIAILSPSWQVVDLREFRVEHHHGLWQDCTRPNRRSNLLSTESHQELQYSALSCTYKFDRDAREIIDENLLDIDQNGWQKAVLICFIVLFASSALALLCGTCAPCSNMIAVCFTLFIFIALFFSIVANAIFFFAAHRVDSRFVQGLIGTYEQEIGSAFYLSITSTSLLLFSFLLALISTYYLVRNSNKVRNDLNSTVLRELTPLYNSSMRHTVI